jgi:hypothetical protein
LADCSEPFGIFTQTLEFTSLEEVGKLVGDCGRGSARDEIRENGLFSYKCRNKDRMDWALRLAAATCPENPEVGKTPGGMMNHTTDSTSAPYYFISYCRQEVTFADSFSRELEKRGIRTWVDFRNLVPGHAWQPQLDDAVKNAAAILLVVSRASMSSLPVKDEWTKSLATGERIILIIMEPCQLDPSLAELEWVDFTRRFDRAMDQLIEFLAGPPQKAISHPPQRWKRIPGLAIRFMMLSIFLAATSVIGVIVTTLTIILINDSVQGMDERLKKLIIFILSQTILFIWLPAVVNFLWLPRRIITRAYHAQKIRNALNGLLFSSAFFFLLILWFTLFDSKVENEVWIQVSLICSSPVLLVIILTCMHLNRLLVSDVMYRWAGPQGALIRITPPDITAHMENGPSMRVAIEYAPQDQLYAQELRASIEKAGHTCTDDLQDNDLVLTLLSKYKTDSKCDPETTRLIPVLIQDCDVDKQLSQLQWIDLRYGRASMDALANLLDQPNELLRILGVLPIRTTIFPTAVKWLVLLLSTLMIISIFPALLAIGLLGISFTALLKMEELDPRIILPIILGLFLPLGIYLLRQFVINRRLKFVPFLSYWWAFGLAAVLAAVLAAFQGGLRDSLPFWLVPLLMLHKDVRLWLPVRDKKRVRDSQPSEVQPVNP